MASPHRLMCWHAWPMGSVTLSGGVAFLDKCVIVGAGFQIFYAQAPTLWDAALFCCLWIKM